MLGTIVTNCHTRRSITAAVEADLQRHFPVLGRVRSDSQLLYATSNGRIADVKSTSAMRDYASVLEQIVAQERGT